MKTPEQIAANARERARRQNEKAKENWDIISCRLPKGTKERIQAHGLTVNKKKKNRIKRTLGRSQIARKTCKRLMNGYISYKTRLQAKRRKKAPPLVKS